MDGEDGDSPSTGGGDGRDDDDGGDDDNGSGGGDNEEWECWDVETCECFDGPCDPVCPGCECTTEERCTRIN